jgi:CheY-like chemotaxis protein
VLFFDGEIDMATGFLGIRLRNRIPMHEIEDRSDEPDELSPSTARNFGVLLVDRDQQTRRAYGQALRALGIAVLAVDDGQRALELYKHCFPTIDLVLIDPRIMVADHRHTLETLQENGLPVRICFLRGRPSSAGDEDFTNARAALLFRKNLCPTELAEIVRLLLTDL